MHFLVPYEHEDRLPALFGHIKVSCGYGASLPCKGFVACSRCCRAELCRGRQPMRCHAKPSRLLLRLFTCRPIKPRWVWQTSSCA